ncbi:MAG: hypothetical protein ACT4ON_10630 [Bacteroidota bacterium]
MNKKTLRKELEFVLVKTIEEVLKNRNTEATRKIKRITFQSSKTIAKKFYKAIKSTSDKKPAPAKGIAKKPVKTAVTKAKAKVKK